MLLGEGEGAMTTDPHERLVEDLASKGLVARGLRVPEPRRSRILVSLALP
jgi:hypothetical protein